MNNTISFALNTLGCWKNIPNRAQHKTTARRREMKLMIRRPKHLTMALLLVVVYGRLAQGQMAAPSILQIDVENFVE
jgi:hypothetical protein